MSTLPLDVMKLGTKTVIHKQKLHFRLLLSFGKGRRKWSFFQFTFSVIGVVYRQLKSRVCVVNICVGGFHNPVVMLLFVSPRSTNPSKIRYNSSREDVRVKPRGTGYLNLEIHL